MYTTMKVKIILKYIFTPVFLNDQYWNLNCFFFLRIDNLPNSQKSEVKLFTGVFFLTTC